MKNKTCNSVTAGTLVFQVLYSPNQLVHQTIVVVVSYVIKGSKRTARTTHALSDYLK